MAKKIFSSLLLLIGISALANAQNQFSLKETIAFGLKNNRTTSIYKNNVLTAKQRAIQSGSAFLPNVNLNAGLDDNLKLPVTVIPEGAFAPGSPEQRVSFGSKFSSSQVVQLDQTIFDIAAFTGLKARQPNIDYAEYQEMGNNENIVYNIAIAYYKIIVAQKQLDLLQDNKSRMEKIYSVTLLRANQGVAKKVDVKQVNVNIANIDAQISIINNSLELAKNTLKFNMGYPLNEPIILTDTGRWLNPEGVNLKENFEFDYRNTSDYKINSTQITLLDVNRKNIYDSRYPTLGFYARYGLNGIGQKLGDAYDKMYDFSTIGLKFSWNIFGGFRKQSSYKIANYDYENAKHNIHLKEDQFRLMFQNAGLAFNRAERTISINNQNMELAREVYDNVSLQTKEGLASLTDLLNAENAYQQAQSNYIQSLLDYYLAEIEVRKANGSITEFYNNL
ncbi:MAG TPA: TolC family protein [Edaphocola sp.]|nr:TolC family protein [Edaphocola sp.]